MKIFENSCCVGCVSARRIASKELEEQGYIGCNILSGKRGLLCYSEDDLNRIVGDIIAYGWVDLGSSPGGKSSGLITNGQLITKDVVSCPWFEKKEKIG